MRSSKIYKERYFLKIKMKYCWLKYFETMFLKWKGKKKALDNKQFTVFVTFYLIYCLVYTAKKKEKNCK